MIIEFHIVFWDLEMEFSAALFPLAVANFSNNIIFKMEDFEFFRAYSPDENWNTVYIGFYD